MSETKDTRITKSEEQARYDEGRMLPPVDVIEDASGITLYADLPGVPRDKLSIRVESDALTIEGEVSLPVAANVEASHAEVNLARYQRSFTLGQELDREKVAAEFKNGVLKLHIPKAEHAKPRKVEVRVA
jgi:HSP20 family molecular chaperone IbpA